MSSGAPDLFVVCKSCGAEVSAYVTECNYCGARLRKRAPKLDREGRPQELKAKRRRRPPTPTLGRLKPGEMPGVRAEGRPVVTIAIVLVSLVALLLVRAGAIDLSQYAVIGPVSDEPWRLLTSPFLYSNTGDAFVCLAGVGLFGGLLERRHGHVAVLALFFLCGSGGMLVASAIESMPVALGANGAALGLLVAWAVPAVQELRAGEEPEADLIGAAVFAAVLLVVPGVIYESDWIVGIAGALIGLGAGLPLARYARR
jgi:membrane associated rhomboid family serine protease